MEATATDMATLVAEVEGLKRKVRLLEDQEKIRECLARFSFTADMGRPEEFVHGVWTEKGVYDLGPTTRIEGSGALDGLIRGSGSKSIENRSQHTVMNLFSRVEGDTAWAEGYSVVFLKEEDRYIAWSNGYNHWEFERRGDRWYMTLRKRRAVGGDEWGGEVIKSFLDQ